MEVRHKKAASVVIYEVRNRERAMYTIACPFDGRRRRQMRREFDTAFSLAEEIALKMADGAGIAILAPARVQHALSEINLIPAEGYKLADSERVPVGDQDHRGVPVPVPSDLLSGLRQLFDLCRGQKLPAPAFSVGALPGWFSLTFPKTRIGGLEGDLDHPSIVARPRSRTFP